MRKPLIAANWKMNLTVKEAVRLATSLKQKLKKVKNKEILLCPSFTALQEVNKAIKNSNIKLGAQDVCYKDKGAYTGEISPKMLKEFGCKYVIVGHSERRHIFNETDNIINLKLKNALKNKLNPILCVGETLTERKSNKTKKVIINQIKKGLKDVSKKDMKNVVIAYEPVWAIGTGKTSSPQDAQKSHNTIRNRINKIYSKGISKKIRILYGGSVTPDNSKELIAQPDIDGSLVGTKSLKAQDFSRIIK
ncbi:triose-phosphate isomerase [Candidatus Woesearchaeota archaeon B3_Woes]|nr:MAG: triose-phosphate isomerase [Candidatus Woesearchaeota archaeon B3_Woes]